MKYSKVIALVLAMMFVVFCFAACGSTTKATEAPASAAPAESTAPVESAVAANAAAPDWTEYTRLIGEIKSSTDFAAREALMHQAEDILMGTGAVCPIYYYNDIYLQKAAVEGIYSNVYGTKFFMYATNGDSTTLKLNLASEPDYLDPALNSSVDGACLAANSFGGLYTYNDKGETVPAFAESYTVSEDGLTYTFTMKDGLKWSDGTPLTAKDFEYSWKRAANPETAADYSYMLNGIAGYDKITKYSETEKDADGNPVAESYDPDQLQVKASEDGKTFTVVLTAPCAYMLDLCAFPTFYAVNQACVEAAKGYKDEAGKVIQPGAWATEAGFVSCGAYKLTEWKHNESMVYEKNDNWYDAANVKVTRLEFMLSADDTAIYAAYQAGNLDFADTVPTDEIQALLKNPEFHIIDNLGTYYVAFNVNSKLFEGKTVEQAANMRLGLSYLIDRDYIVETVAQTGQQVATSFIPAKMLDGHGGEFKANDADYTFPEKDDLGYFTKAPNKDKAIELLTSAGYKFTDGKLDASNPISIEYIVNENTGHTAVAECLQQDFAAIGITMTIKTLDWDVFLQERKQGHFDVAREGWLADFNDPINMLEMWLPESGNNDCQFGR